MSNWTLKDLDKGNTNSYDDRSTALDQAKQLYELGVNVALEDPRGNEVDLDLEGEEPTIEDGDDSVDDTHAGEDAPQAMADGQGEVVVEDNPQATDGDVAAATTQHDIPESRNVSEDPLLWMPDEFTDEIDGSTAINRKGYAVLAHHYDIDVQAEVQVSPHETEFEYAQVTAVATTRDGREYRAHGSAHVDRGDDSFLLLEMADTRAQKRALAMATGVGTVAVEELQNELGGA